MAYSRDDTGQRPNNRQNKPNGAPFKGSRGFRKGSGDGNRNFNRDQDDQRGPRQNKRIQHQRNDRRFAEKGHKKVTKDKHDLDKQMREYWIKTGSTKGKEDIKKEGTLASQKMNEEMDDYWKQVKQKQEQQVENKPQV